LWWSHVDAYRGFSERGKMSGMHITYQQRDVQTQKAEMQGSKYR
jgi:hypothetical protein